MWGFPALVAWLRARGGFVSEKLALGRADGGLRGLYAVEPVEEGGEWR